SAVFTAADPVDDAGQTRTRNQRAVLRALIQGLKSAGLAKDPNKAATVLGHFASGIQHNAELTTVELGKIANSLRALRADDLAVVTVPTNSRRNDDGTVIIDVDPEAMPAMQNALAGNDLPEWFRYLVSLGYCAPATAPSSRPPAPNSQRGRYAARSLRRRQRRSSSHRCRGSCPAADWPG